jgi:hypothetical protein
LINNAGLTIGSPAKIVNAHMCCRKKHSDQPTTWTPAL